MRGMRQERRIPKQEGFLLLRRLIDKIRDRCHPLPTDFQTLIAVPAAAFRVSMSHAVGKPTILIRPLPPFP